MTLKPNIEQTVNDSCDKSENINRLSKMSKQEKAIMEYLSIEPTKGSHDLHSRTNKGIAYSMTAPKKSYKYNLESFQKEYENIDFKTLPEKRMVAVRRKYKEARAVSCQEHNVLRASTNRSLKRLMKRRAIVSLTVSSCISSVSLCNVKSLEKTYYFINKEQGQRFMDSYDGFSFQGHWAPASLNVGLNKIEKE